MTEPQNLTLSGGQVALTRPSEMFTQRLWDLATTACDASERRAKLGAIARSPKLREEAATLLPELDRMIAGRSSNAEVEAALAPLLLVKRRPDFGQGVDLERMTAAWLAIYRDQLRKYPISAVRAAVKDLLASHPYPDMPQPAELVKATEPYAAKIVMARGRLKMALEMSAPAQPIDRAANRKALAEAGWLNPDGTVSAARILTKGVKRPNYRRPAESPQEMAERLRKGVGQ